MTDLPADLTFRAVEMSTWPDFERLFASRGAPHYCWCQVYRATRGAARQANRAELKAAMCERIHQGMHVGLLAVSGRCSGPPVFAKLAAWASGGTSCAWTYASPQLLGNRRSSRSPSPWRVRVQRADLLVAHQRI